MWLLVVFTIFDTYMWDLLHCLCGTDSSGLLPFVQNPMFDIWIPAWSNYLMNVTSKFPYLDQDVFKAVCYRFNVFWNKVTHNFLTLRILECYEKGLGKICNICKMDSIIQMPSCKHGWKKKKKLLVLNILFLFPLCFQTDWLVSG